MKRLLRSFLLGFLVLVLAAPAALAAAPTHVKVSFADSFPENVCGIDVTVSVQVRGNVLLFENRTVDLSSVRLTLTNDDGDWLRNSVNGPVFIEERLDGDILSFTLRFVGVHSKWRSSEGLTAAFDRGQIVFEDVIDLNDPADPSDDVVLSSGIVFQAGPHPEADSDFALFCEVVNEVLG